MERTCYTVLPSPFIKMKNHPPEKKPLSLQRALNKSETDKNVDIKVQYCNKIDIKPKRRLDLRLSDESSLKRKYRDLHWVLGCLNLQNSPAPRAVIDLLKCGCWKGSVRNCSCGKNGLPCTEMCGCVKYECRNPFNGSIGEKSEIEAEDFDID